MNIYMVWMVLPRIRPFVIGMVHVGPLPGSPKYSGNLDKLIQEAVENAVMLVEGGVDAVLVENFYDAPFPKNRADPATVASMTVIVREVTKTINVPVGINILRNCGIDAAAVAAVTRASFIRVNALSEVVITDQGVLEPIALDLMRYLKLVGYRPAVLADVHVKHGKPLAERPIEIVAYEAVKRGGADAVIVSGGATGSEASINDVIKVKNVVNVPVIVGSGITAENVASFLRHADGAIVGTYFKEGREISLKKVRALMDKVQELRK